MNMNIHRGAALPNDCEASSHDWDYHIFIAPRTFQGELFTIGLQAPTNTSYKI